MTSDADITPLILTYNEAPNLDRTLSRLTWARQILVVDSFSTDATESITRKYAQTRVIQRRFDTFASQCNFGLDHIRTPWVLSLDADYVLTWDFIREIRQLNFCPGIAGYEARFRYCILGRRLRSSLYPPRTVLYRRDKARYVDEGHSHRVKVAGAVGKLSGWIAHDDRKPLDRWFREQTHYALAEARYLLETPQEELNVQDRLRCKVVIAPLLLPLYTLFVKGLVLDGWPGSYYVLQRLLSESLLSLCLLEARLRLSPGSRWASRPRLAP